MVDIRQRAALRDALTELIEGRTTNDQFDDLYACQWAESGDRAVVRIGDFGHCLYTDLRTCHLEGRYAIDSETRKIAQRCLRFLQSDLEYAWPQPPGTRLQSAAGGLAIFLLLPLGIVLLICSLILRPVLIAGLADLGLTWFLWWWSRDYDTADGREYWSNGDRDAWPFLHLPTDEPVPP
jgi:hypothetical protein